jgi:hypothetical protein
MCVYIDNKTAFLCIGITVCCIVFMTICQTVNTDVAVNNS